MNIILKSFDGRCDKQVIEEAFRGKKLGLCISITNTVTHKPDLDAARHVWMSAIDLREGLYREIDWNTVTPLAAELLEKMRECEAIFLMMMDRKTRYRDVSYYERQQEFRRHLRYWNHVLSTENINVLLMNHVPHQCYDWVLYCLCILRNIPVLFLERANTIDVFYVVRTVEESAKILKEQMDSLRRQYANPEVAIPLSPKFEEYFRLYTNEKVEPWRMFWRRENFKETSFVKKWGRVALRMLYHKPRYLFSSVCSPTFWTRKIRQHRTFALYDRYIVAPDLNQPYVYLPLHLQPEATTCPMAGAYGDQQIMVQLLAACLPPGVRLYVKEHPTQEERCRNEEFYSSMLQIPSVSFLPRDFDSFSLIENAVAVATATGTAGFEALFRKKPVLLFGHRFYQYASGVYPVHSEEDCRSAVASIFERREVPSLRDARLFLKALEETGDPYVGGPPSPHEHRDENEKIRIMGACIARHVHPFFTH